MRVSKLTILSELLLREYIINFNRVDNNGMYSVESVFNVFKQVKSISKKESIQIKYNHMNINRKDFVKKACVSGACLCGFSSLLAGNPGTNIMCSSSDQDDKQKMFQDYLAKLFSNIDSTLKQSDKRKIIKDCALIHYDNVKMDEVLKPFIGNLDSFLSFLKEQGHWKIEYNSKTKTIIADENKDYCPCPLIEKEKRISGAICYCSEGFTEKMFSTVLQKPVSASVISSIQRGGSKCVYKITIT
jgi:hypothetical protein